MSTQGRRFRVGLVWLLRLLCVLATVAGVDNAVAVVGSGQLGDQPSTLIYAVLSGFVFAFGAFVLSEALAIEGGLRSAIAIRLEAVWIARGIAALLFVLTMPTIFAIAKSVVLDGSATCEEFGPGAVLHQILFGLYNVLHAPLLLLGFAEVLRSARPPPIESAA